MTDLQIRFAFPPAGSPVTESCPDIESLTRVITGGAAEPEFERFLEHTALCAACTVSWRLIRALGQQEARTEPAPELAAPASSWWKARAPLATAAALIIGVAMAALYWAPSGLDTHSIYRGPHGLSIRSFVPEGAVVPRGDCVLRWSAGPPGTRYNVLVTDGSLRTLAQARSLDKEEFSVPERVLAGLDRGARILWQVDATLPDGYVASSATFTLTVE